MHPSDALIAHDRAMAGNNAWSNDRLQVACAALSERDYRARRASFFPSLHLTLRHILEVDRFTSTSSKGREPSAGTWTTISPSRRSPTSPAQRATDRRLIAYCARLTPAILAEDAAKRAPDLRALELG